MMELEGIIGLNYSILHVLQLYHIIDCKNYSVCVNFQALKLRQYECLLNSSKNHLLGTFSRNYLGSEVKLKTSPTVSLFY